MFVQQISANKDTMSASIAAILKDHIDLYMLCYSFYIIESQRKTYAYIIYAYSSENDWGVSGNVRDRQVGVPLEKIPVVRPKKYKGKPKRKHLPSHEKYLIEKCKCSCYGGYGHNIASFKSRF